MWVAAHGVPFDVAFSLDETTLTAMAIIVSEQHTGKQYDWKSREFVDRS